VVDDIFFLTAQRRFHEKYNVPFLPGNITHPCFDRLKAQHFGLREIDEQLLLSSTRFTLD
jgi:hypothetical protein